MNEIEKAIADIQNELFDLGYQTCLHDNHKMSWSEAEELQRYRQTGLTPAEVAELAQGKKDRRLVVLPCKLGRMIYIMDDGKIQRCIVEKPISHDGIIAIGVGIDKGYGVYKENIGKIVFLTKPEAQAALDGTEEQG